MEPRQLPIPSGNPRNTIESDPIEEVAFFRDEIANLAWAVERSLPGLTPAPVAPSADVAAQALADPATPDAALIYRLQTPMPRNWYPLVPEMEGTLPMEP